MNVHQGRDLLRTDTVAWFGINPGVDQSFSDARREHGGTDHLYLADFPHLGDNLGETEFHNHFYLPAARVAERFVRFFFGTKASGS